MASSSLKSKTVSGLFWMAIQRYSKMFIQFVSGIILARMLTPYDYGCIGMVMVFVSLSEVFIDGGFGSALIQKKRPDETDYSTVFYWNLCVAVISYFILFACAPWISR
ncbi:MAG: oligosaccharide flippase family protein, partial [Bacteroidales bacterium]|nr:oligosaccharide flippase family protein [Bacteroidales bacterium]